MFIPVGCQMRMRNDMPIIEVKCECTDMNAQPVVILKVVDLIQSANKFKGVPFHEKPNFETKCALTISFSLIFPSQAECGNYMKSILGNT